MVEFTTVVLISAFFLNIDDIQTAPVSQGDFDIQCRARVHEFDVRCHWQDPPSLGENDTCSLYYMVTPGHPHLMECEEYLDWTECIPDGDPHLCYLPRYPEDFSPSVFGSCGPEIDMKVMCTDGQSSHVLTVDSMNITVPDPIVNLKVSGSGVSEVRVKWDQPPSWQEEIGLIFVIEYWQEHSNVRYEMVQTERDDMQNVCSEIIHENLAYADTLTCVRVAGYFHLNPLKTLSDWSEKSCSKTFIDAPRDSPRNIQVEDIEVDWEKQTRKVNITWDPIPVYLQGGPILEYIIMLCGSTPEGGCSPSEHRVLSNQTQYILVLDALSAYKIDIRARNEVGQSDIAEYIVEELTPPSDGQGSFRTGSSPVYYVGIVVACCIVLLVLISSCLVLKKKMTVSHLPPIELPEKSLTVVINPLKKEEEVFDSLKTRSQISAISDMRGDSSRYLDGIRDSTNPLLPKNGHILQKLDLNGEHMPLVEDADLYGGEVSPTDSGLQCDDFLIDSQGEPSPIPMSFPPGNSPTRRIDSDNQNSEVANLPPESMDDTSGVSLASSPSDSGQSGEGYVVQALAHEYGDMQTTGDSVIDGSAYNDGSVMSSIGGYVQMTTTDTDGCSDGQSSPYVAKAPILNSGSSVTEGSMPSYVQQDVAEVFQDGTNRVDSGTSSCPSYVKQSEVNSK